MGLLGELYHPISDFFAAPVLAYSFHIFGVLEGSFGIINPPAMGEWLCLSQLSSIPSKACLGGVRAAAGLCSSIFDVLRVWLCVSGEICWLMAITWPRWAVLPSQGLT